MGSNIKFTSLTCDSEPDAPLCHLLDIDGFRFLIDCGWTDGFDTERLEPVKRILDTVDAVLISHPDLAHIGALPYLVGKCGLAAPIYTTGPVRKMGEMLMYDLFLAKKAISDFDTYDLNDVDAAFAFSKWESVRYFQHFNLLGKGAGITITPFNAGRFVGGSIWKISKGGEELVYAVDFCHRKERHLNEAAIMTLELFHRPALLVASALSTLSPPINGVQRDTAFLEVVIATLRGDGSVLLPVDTSGRVLEMAMFLDEYWARERMVYPLVLLSDMAPTVVDFAKQQLEWMSEQIGRAFESKRTNPFAFRFLKVISSIEQLARLPLGPKVVLASSPSLECGYSRQLFMDWAGDAKNTVCFVQRAKIGTLADTLQRHVVGPNPFKLKLSKVQRVPLEGEELLSYLRQKENEDAATADEQAVKEEEDGDEDGKTLKALNAGAAPTQSLASCGITPSRRASVLRTSSVALGLAAAHALVPLQAPVSANRSMLPDVLLDGFEQPKGAAHPMFPDEDEAMLEVWDDYGVVVHPEDLLMLPPNSFFGNPGGTAAGGASGSGRGTKPGPGSAPEAMEVDAPGKATAEAEAEEEKGEPPTKLVDTKVDINVLAAIRYFDFDARADGRILKKVLQDIAPRQLIIVQGSAKAKEELRMHCQLKLADFRTRVIVPGPSEAVDVSLLPAYQLCLSDALNARAQMKGMRNYGLAHIDGIVGPPDPHQPSMLQLLPPREGAGAGEGIFIADSEDGVQLSDIKKALADAGIESMFQAGCLVCGAVTISKGSGDKAHLMLEGTLSAEFYRIREAIYGTFSVC